MVYYATNYIRMIYKGSYDTKDWHNNSFAITKMNYILKYAKNKIDI